MDATVGLYSFQDVDLFREVLRGWDTEPTQLSSGRLLVRWDQLTFDDMTISRLRTNRKIADRTGYQAGHVGFVVCLGSKTFCGRCVNAGSLVLFGPGREYRNLLEENWKFLRDFDDVPAFSVVKLRQRGCSPDRDRSGIFCAPALFTPRFDIPSLGRELSCTIAWRAKSGGRDLLDCSDPRAHAWSSGKGLP